MRKLVQLVGIPGSGKSYLLRQIGIPGINYIEFGKQFRKCRKEEGYDSVTPEIVRKFLDLIILPMEPAVFTSHIVSDEEGQFTKENYLDAYVLTAGYIHVLACPEDIYSRRIQDNIKKTKIRDVSSLERIREHQELSFNLSRETASLLGARFLSVHNSPEAQEGNLVLIRKFLTEVLLNGKFS